MTTARTAAAHVVDQAQEAAHNAAAEAYGASAAGKDDQTRQEADAKEAHAWCELAYAESEATKEAYTEDDVGAAFGHAAKAYEAAANATRVAEESSKHNEAAQAKASDARSSAHQAGANSEGAW